LEQAWTRKTSILHKKIGMSLPGCEKEEYLYLDQDGHSTNLSFVVLVMHMMQYQGNQLHG